MAGVRARRRPRRTSVNFRRLYWVLLREAALRVLAPELVDAPHWPELRHLLARQRSHHVLHVARLLLYHRPERRAWPGPPL